MVRGKAHILNPPFFSKKISHIAGSDQGKWSDTGGSLLFVIWITFLVMAAGALAKEAASANEGPRVALVIGNGAYAKAPIEGAVGNARAVADVLRMGGFDVVYMENAKKADIAEAVRILADKMERGASAVVYYTGHVVRYDGRNFLLPIDFDIKSEAEIRTEGFDADLLLDPLIVRRSAGSVVILDASRPNPWNRLLSWPRPWSCRPGPSPGYQFRLRRQSRKDCSRRQFLLGADQGDEDTWSWFRYHYQSYANRGVTHDRQTTGGLGILHASKGSDRISW